MALLPRRSALAAAFVAALLGGAIVPTAVSSAATVPAPVLTGPADNTSTPLKDVVLTWDAVDGANEYQVQISPNGEWTNNTVTLPSAGDTVATTYDVPLSLPHDTYFWRVRAEIGTVWGSFSSSRSFLREWEAPFTILQSPTSADPTISWTPVQDASAYLVRYGTARDFDTAGGNTSLDCTVNQTSFTPYDLVGSAPEQTAPCVGAGDSKTVVEALTSGTDYYWSVVPEDDSTATPLVTENGNDEGIECPAAQPECDADYYVSPTTFHYTAPTGGAVSGPVTGLTTSVHTTSLPGTACDTTTACTATPTFSWNPVAGASSYEVAVYRDPDLTNAYHVYRTMWPSVTPRDSYLDAQAGKAYYWVVEAIGTGGSSAVSAVASFDKASGSVNLTSPANNASMNTRTPTLSWSDFENTGGSGAYDARNYDLQVSATRDFSNPLIDETDIDMTQFTNPDGLFSDGSYFWRVAPIDESGNTLTWSTVRDFIVDATGPTATITTKNGIGVTDPITITFSKAIDGVSTSTVRLVPKDGTAADVANGKLKASSNGKTYTFTPTTPLITGARYELVVSPTLVDGNGNSVAVTGNGVKTTTVAKNSSEGWSYSKGWTRHKASGARSGGYVSAKSGRTATVSYDGAKAKLFACLGPDMGKIRITVTGAKTQTINEHQSYTKCGVDIANYKVVKGGNERTMTIKVIKGGGNIDELKVT